MKNRKIIAFMLLVLCVVMSTVLMGCDTKNEEKIVSDKDIFDQIIEENIALNGYTLQSLTVELSSDVEIGSYNKSVQVKEGIATTSFSEKRLKTITIGGVNDGKYETIVAPNIETLDYNGERVNNLITCKSMKNEGLILTKNGSEITLSALPIDISLALNITDIALISDCNVTAVVDTSTKKLKSYLITYNQGNSKTTLTYLQVA